MPVFASKALTCAFTWSTPADQAKKLIGSAPNARPSAPKVLEPASAAAADALRKSRRWYGFIEIPLISERPPYKAVFRSSTTSCAASPVRAWRRPPVEAKRWPAEVASEVESFPRTHGGRHAQGRHPAGGHRSRNPAPRQGACLREPRSPQDRTPRRGHAERVHDARRGARLLPVRREHRAECQPARRSHAPDG